MRGNRLFSIVTALAVMCCLISGISDSTFAAEEYPCIVKETVEGDLRGKVVILHSNDVHGAIEGYAAITALKKDLEKKGAEVIMTDAGDFSQGDPYVNISEGADAVILMNEAGYRYATIGNHEFDFGTEKLQDNLEKAEFRVLCANAEKDGKAICDAHDIYKTANGVNIGFFGLCTPETITKSSPLMVKDMSFISGKELHACAEEQAKELRDEGADLVIALTHLGVAYESSIDENSSLDVFANAKGIDFMIDGHSHTEMTAGDNGEPIQSTGTKFKYIGVIVVNGEGSIEDNYLIPVEGQEKDSEELKSIKKIENEVDSVLGIVIGHSETGLKGKESIARVTETALGDFVTDAMKWYITKNADDLKVDIDNAVVIENGGCIRDDLPIGDITRKDLITVFPFGNTVSVVYVTGEELLEVLEASTFCSPEPVGSFPQTAGIEYTLDTTKEFDSGEIYGNTTYHKPASIRRVSIKSINGKPFSKTDTYAVVTNDFCSSGGDTYFVFGSKKSYDTGVLFDKVLTDYIKEELGGIISEKRYGEVRGDLTMITSGDTAAADKGNSDEKAAPDGSYEVIPGDSLWKIALKIYGDGCRWTEIYELNKKTIKDPSLIYVGTILKIPA